jgi:hypothetical protein
MISMDDGGRLRLSNAFRTRLLQPGKDWHESCSCWNGKWKHFFFFFLGLKINNSDFNSCLNIGYHLCGP